MSDYGDGSGLTMPAAHEMSGVFQSVPEFKPEPAECPPPLFFPHPLLASNSPFLSFSSSLSDYSSIDELQELAGYEASDLPLPALSASPQVESTTVDGSVRSSNSSDSGGDGGVDLQRGTSSSRTEEERRAKHRLIDVQRRHTETALLEQLEKLANLPPDEPLDSVAAAAETHRGGARDSLSVPTAAAGAAGKRTRRKRGRLTLLRSSVAKMAELKETIASLTATCSSQAQMLEQHSAAVAALRGSRQQQQALQQQQRRDEYVASHQSLSSCFLRGTYGLLLIDVASGSVMDCNSLYCQWTSWPREALLNSMLVTPHSVLLHYDESDISRFQQMRDRHLVRYRDNRPLVQQPPNSGNWTRSRPVRQYGSSLRALLALETGRASSIREPWHCRWGDGYVYQTTMSIYVTAAEDVQEPDGRTWKRPTQMMYVMAYDDCVKVGDL